MDPIGTALVAAGAKAAGGPVAALIKSIGTDAYNTLTSKFQSCFQGHVEATLNRCSKMKNILYRDQSVDFISQYVNINFALGDKKLSDKKALSRIISGEKILICGTAGAGKTMFMRWSALELIKGMKDHGRIPLYLEMRYFEDSFEKEPLERYIYSKTSSVEDTSSYGQFVEGLKSGLFIVLLDAIDEIKPSVRGKVVGKVMDFLRSYPLCGVAVSSRFDDKLESIQDFVVLRTTPMDMTQIICVIERLEYDCLVKNKLIGRLRSGLYGELKEFLSNPLLATIMLLTFDHSADIPTKLTAFYQQAFEALYQRHDAAKGAYKRAHHAGLPLDRYESIFSTFSFQTYLNYKFEFSDGELLSAFREACEYDQEDVDPELLIQDSMESVCLLQKDGLDTVFSHRSFQEYFCALFVSKYREADVAQLIEAIASMENRSNVLRMLYELSPEAFEYEWVLPILKKFLAEFGRVRPSTKTGLARMMSAVVSGLTLSLESNRLEYVSWSVGTNAATGPAVKWMSVIQAATHGQVSLFSTLFQTPLWDDFDAFLETVPVEVRPTERDLSRRTTKMGTSREDFGLRLSAEDAPWLIYSNLPALFEKLRTRIVSYHDEITERRANRRSAVSNLLKSPRRRTVSLRKRTRG